MRHHSASQTILTTLLVIAGVWGIGYLGMKGLAHLRAPVTVVVSDPEITLDKTNEAAAVSAVSRTAANNETSERQTSIRIMMGGDVMLDRNVRALGERNGYASLFDPALAALFESADIAVVNLEGPITSHPSKTLVDGKTTPSFTFTFSPRSTAALIAAGIDIVSLANNHTDNFAFLGYRETQDWLAEDGIQWFGNPWNSTTTNMSRNPFQAPNSALTTHVTKEGITVAFVGYHAFQTGVDRVIADIRRVSSSEGPVFTIVMPHWGDEYTRVPSDRMKSLARSFIAAGADAIIGAHPHVIMEHEWVDSVPVYYSVGNLLFDQYFSPEVMEGLVVELHLERTGDDVHLESLRTHEIQLVSSQGARLVPESTDTPEPTL